MTVSDERRILEDLVARKNAFLSQQPEVPFVTLSFAQSLDGVLSQQRQQATKLSDWQADVMTHRIRSVHDGIIIGVNTLIVDNPQLSVRHVEGPSPRPVIIDPKLQSPLNSRLLQPSQSPKPLLIVDQSLSQVKRDLFRDKAEVLTFDYDHPQVLSSILKAMVGLGLRSMMVEGGGRTIYHFLRSGLVHYFVMTLSPRILGSRNSVRYSDFEQNLNRMLQAPQYQQLGRDMIVYGHLAGETRTN